MTRKICYTCITGGYDTPMEIEYKTPGWEYILFTDNAKLKSKTWKVVKIRNSMMLDPVRFARHVKTEYEWYLPKHHINLWVDGNVRIHSNLNEFMSKINNKGSAIYLVNHPDRKCIYEEAKACIARGKDSPDIINKQMEYYQKYLRIPKDIGLHETNCMLRIDHPDVRHYMRQWFQLINMFSRRDQLAFDVIRKRFPTNFVQGFSSQTRDSYCEWNPGHAGKSEYDQRTLEQKILMDEV